MQVCSVDACLLGWGLHGHTVFLLSFCTQQRRCEGSICPPKPRTYSANTVWWGRNILPPSRFAVWMRAFLAGACMGTLSSCCPFAPNKDVARGPFVHQNRGHTQPTLSGGVVTFCRQAGLQCGCVPSWLGLAWAHCLPAVLLHPTKTLQGVHLSTKTEDILH